MMYPPVHQVNNLLDQNKNSYQNGESRWSARALMGVLGYSNWQNFENVILRAIESRQAMGYSTSYEFQQISASYISGNGGQQYMVDYLLTAEACCAISIVADHRKPEVAVVHDYFIKILNRHNGYSTWSREQARLSEYEQHRSRKISFRNTLDSHDIPKSGYNRIYAKGYTEMHGGNTMQDMKKRWNVPPGHSVDSYEPEIGLTMMNLGLQFTARDVENGNLRDERDIAQKNIENSRALRAFAEQRCGVRLEDMPPEEHIGITKKRVKEQQALMEQQHNEVSVADAVRAIMYQQSTGFI